jgi:hypothetical protein
MTELRQLAVVRDYPELIAALRQRAVELDVSREMIDEISGNQPGYTAKLLAPVPIRALGRVSLGPIIQAMGLALIVVEDLATFEKIQSRLTKRINKRRKVSDASGVMPARKRKKKSALLGNSEWGRLMRMRQLALMSDIARHRLARKAANALWRQKRALAKQQRAARIIPPIIATPAAELRIEN